MTLADRVREMIRETGLSQEQLAEKANTSQGTISNILNGTTKRPRNIVEIASVFNVEPTWLQNGTGNKYCGQLIVAEPMNNDVEDTGELIIIDVLNVEASAGHGSLGDLVKTVRQLRYFPDQFYSLFRGLNPDVIQVINVKGDSMSPTFAPGDLAFVDVSIQYFDGDGVYVFNYGDSLYLKRLQKAGNEFIVISDNETYREWRISADHADELFIHGKVKVHQSQRLNFIG